MSVSFFANFFITNSTFLFQIYIQNVFSFHLILAEWGPPGPFSSPFGFAEVLELETLIFKLEKTIIAHFKDLDKPIKMASLNLKGYFLF